MKGDLTSTFEKNGKKIVRKLNADRTYTSKDGKKLACMEELCYLIEMSVI